VRVTDDLRRWFDAAPWRTSRELLERLQAEHPGQYPDHLLRILQRRMKLWRTKKAPQKRHPGSLKPLYGLPMALGA
jgi:hypothetical protein